jgi:hypothetical protein
VTQKITHCVQWNAVLNQARSKVKAQLRPRVSFFGHHHTRVDAEISGVLCIGLNKVEMPGHLVAIEMEPRKWDWSLIGEDAEPGIASGVSRESTPMGAG